MKSLSRGGGGEGDNAKPAGAHQAVVGTAGHSYSSAATDYSRTDDDEGRRGGA